ncbi:MAG: hypothetical protein ACRDFX_05410 [Chloroflexota bacterium]
MSYVALWIVVAVQFLATFALYHHFGQMYLGSEKGRDAQGPKVESRFKPLDTWDIVGHPVVLPVPGAAAITLFTSTSCPLCDKLRPQLRSFADAHP